MSVLTLPSSLRQSSWFWPMEREHEGWLGTVCVCARARAHA